MAVSLRDLEEIGSAEVGVAMGTSVQTPGGLSNLKIKRRYKVRANIAYQYLFQILNPSVRETDPTYPTAYLVRQALAPHDKANAMLECEFWMIPTLWNEAKYQPVTFPGVLKSSLYPAPDFPFRGSNFTRATQARHQHQYFLGPINSIPTIPYFQPVDAFGNRTNIITDFTTPSADEYISYVYGRQELVMESVVLPVIGDIWDQRTLYAIAQ